MLELHKGKGKTLTTRLENHNKRIGMAPFIIMKIKTLSESPIKATKDRLMRKGDNRFRKSNLGREMMNRLIFETKIQKMAKAKGIDRTPQLSMASPVMP